MAKLCSSFGSSPVSFFFNEWALGSAADDFYIKPDPRELFGDLNHFPSIYSDIQKIESDSSSICDSGLSSMDTCELDIKPEIRNMDCMWSAATTNVLSTSASSIYSDIGTTAVPLAAITGSGQNMEAVNGISSNATKHQQQQQRSSPTVVVANNRKLHEQQQQQQLQLAAVENIKMDIKEEVSDDYEQQLKPHSIGSSRSAGQQQSSMQHIPPGTSLLRRSTTQQQQQHQQRKTVQQAQRGAAAVQVTRRDQLLPSSAAAASAASATSILNSTPSALNNVAPAAAFQHQRPDTPHSLDDDCATTEFRHNVDLRACVMGSNNISLTIDPTHFIQQVSQELQDTSKNQIDLRFVGGGCNSLAEVLDVIVKDNNNSSSVGSCSTLSPTTASVGGGDGGGGGGGGDNVIVSANLSVNSSASLRSSDCDSDEESTAESSLSSLLDAEPSHTSNMISNHYMQHSDHSYTRCKDGMDDLSTNLETPSDSEEEIDVVSIGDKKLPTNPSNKDRRALQTKVAHKFSNARIVKTANGVRTILPRRRGSYEFPYTPASSSPVKSLTNSRYPSPASTPYQNQYTTKYVQQQQQQQQQTMMAVLAGDSQTAAPINIMSDKSRKRMLATTGGAIINGGSNGLEYAMPLIKKHRGKRSKHLVATHGGGVAVMANGVIKRHYSLDEAADTIEKRNLHNDMERQRRIGLKNLFEALKKQIPSIKDKERAPKVNILREAAKLCEALTREDQQLTEQLARLREHMKRQQELLAHLKAVRLQQRD